MSNENVKEHKERRPAVYSLLETCDVIRGNFGKKIVRVPRLERQC